MPVLKKESSDEDNARSVLEAPASLELDLGLADIHGRGNPRAPEIKTKRIKMGMRVGFCFMPCILLFADKVLD